MSFRPLLYLFVSRPRPSVLDAAEPSGRQPGPSHRVTVKYEVNSTAGEGYLSHSLSLCGGLSFLHRAEKTDKQEAPKSLTWDDAYCPTVPNSPWIYAKSSGFKLSVQSLPLTICCLILAVLFSITAKICLRIFVFPLCVLHQNAPLLPAARSLHLWLD